MIALACGSGTAATDSQVSVHESTPSVVHSRPMHAAAPVAVIDTLNGLLEAELGSVFRYMEEGSPYLSRADASVRQPLAEMVRTNKRHILELGSTIDRLGGFPVPRSIRPEEQFLAYLNLKFLLPKLANDKRLMIERYENALRAIKQTAPADVVELLETHLARHRADLELLDRATAQSAEKKT